MCEKLSIPNPKTDKEVASFILDLHSIYEECFFKLKAVKEILEDENVTK